MLLQLVYILGVLISAVSRTSLECQSVYDPTELIQPTSPDAYLLHSTLIKPSVDGCCTSHWSNHLSDQVWMTVARHTDQTNFLEFSRFLARSLCQLSLPSLAISCLLLQGVSVVGSLCSRNFALTHSNTIAYYLWLTIKPLFQKTWQSGSSRNANR